MNMTAKDALEVWDNGDLVKSIEMGGLGPGYEQAIHITVFELIRELADTDLSSVPKEELNGVLDKALSENAVISNLGLSGAQAGAAKNLAYAAMIRGWDQILTGIPEDRTIFVSKHWPKAE